MTKVFKPGIFARVARVLSGGESRAERLISEQGRFTDDAERRLEALRRNPVWY